MFLGPRGSSNARYVSLAFVPRTGSVSFFIVMRPLDQKASGGFAIINNTLPRHTTRANEFSNFYQRKEE